MISNNYANRKRYEREVKIKKITGKINTDLVLQILWTIFRTFLLVGICFIILFPIIYMLSTTFMDVKDINDPSVIWIPKHFTLDNIKQTMKAMHYKEAIINTLKVGIVSALIQVMSCGVVGYGFARFRFKERKFLLGLVVFTIIVPPQTTIIPTYLNYRLFDFVGFGKILGLITGKQYVINLVNTPWTFYLPAIMASGIRSGLFILIFMQFFRGMPKELENAAIVDGCGPLRTFFKVMLPNAKSAIITVLLFSIVWYWNDYYMSSMFFSKNLPISVSLSRIRSLLHVAGVAGEGASIESVRVYIQAGSLLTILPILILYIVTQKYFTESIERTGIVG